MTQAEFLRLPELLTRRQVVDCGVPRDSVDFLRTVVSSGNQTVEFGRIGAVQLPGRHCKTKGSAKWKYRKADVAVIVGYKTQ